MKTTENEGPLAGYTVIELCSTIAGPACARLLADFGAEVIKIEPSDGDPVRNMGSHDGNVSLYATSILRNKQSVSINLRTPQGQSLVRKLIAQADIVVENFRPGTLERLGLDYASLSKDNPGLVMVRISGYGQTGPYKDRPGYGVTCEAIAGVRHMTGDPDRPPARVALAVTDEHTAVFAAFGALMAILQRQKTGKGQIVDSTLYESAFSMMEPHVPAYDRLKIIPKRVGSNLPSTAPNSLYPTQDGSFVLIAANNDVIFKRLAQAMDQPELSTDERYATQRARAARVKEVNKIVEDWAAHYSAAEIETRLIAAEVPVSKVFTIEDIFHDPHFKQREMLVQVPHPEFGELTLMGVVPKLSDTPGKIRHAGHKVGQDTTEVLQNKLGLNMDELNDLLKQGVIHTQS
ncbi:CaiB/BaiF CoA transferase family protein [Zwartia sp.]|uniref:CaiB/BaiF CoA transferase family protein n=1 Tax=Zwartia sp. TaxID=2978004 RepID=UPI003BAF7F27